MQISPTRIPHTTSPPRTVDSYSSSRVGYYRYQGAANASSSSWSDPAHSPPRSREFQPAVAARSFSPVRNSEFHPLLYPGSVRAASLSRPGLLTETNTAGLPSRPLMRSDAASVSGGTVYAFPQRRGTYAGAAASVAGDTHASSAQFSYGPGRYARSTSTESINWEELMGAASFERLLPAGDAPSPTTAVCESPEPSPLIPAQQMLMQTHLRVIPQSLVHSPSLGTVSSPASSALGNSPIGSGAYEVRFYFTSYMYNRRLTYFWDDVGGHEAHDGVVDANSQYSARADVHSDAEQVRCSSLSQILCAFN